MATLTWLGHSAFRIDTDRDKRVYIDPFLTGNPSTPEHEKTPERVDVIAITHGHGDHVGDTVELSKRFPEAEIVCQVELKKFLGRQGANIGETPGLNKGGTHRIGDLFFSLTDARHSSSDDETGAYLGEACGVVIKLEDGVPVYFAGDTCVFADMQVIAYIHEPQLVVLPIGDHFTMGPYEASIALDMLGKPRCVPCHWGTYPILTGTPAALAALAEGSTVEEIEPGETIQI
jgi:L-ascorbate metabolism protein UlaG (beta-lactamase superfamily)